MELAVLRPEELIVITRTLKWGIAHALVGHDTNLGPSNLEFCIVALCSCLVICGECLCFLVFKQMASFIIVLTSLSLVAAGVKQSSGTEREMPFVNLEVYKDVFVLLFASLKAAGLIENY